jgi:outer membrane protease
MKLISTIALPLIRVLALVVLFLVPAATQGQGSSPAYTLSTSASMGMLYGSAFEELYNQSVATDYKNSELWWPFQPLFYAGAGLDFRSRLGIFASLDLREGLDGRTGTMTDSDFLNGDGVKTNYSESDCYTERAILLDLKVGYEAPLVPRLRLGGFVGFSYMDFKWSARDGYYQYPTSGSGYYIDSSGVVQDPKPYTPWSAGETKTPIYGTGILYEQAYLIGSLGVRASYRILDALTLAGSCSVAPLAFCYTEDNHELRTIDFYSTLKGGIMVEPDISAEYAIKPGASLKLALAFRSLFNLKGDITQVDQGTTSTESGYDYYAGPDSSTTGANDSGASISMLDVSLVFRLVF